MEIYRDAIISSNWRQTYSLLTNKLYISLRRNGKISNWLRTNVLCWQHWSISREHKIVISGRNNPSMFVILVLIVNNVIKINLYCHGPCTVMNIGIPYDLHHNVQTYITSAQSRTTPNFPRSIWYFGQSRK